MPRVTAEKQYNSFIKGLITEASPLTFPENAFLAGDNVVLNRDGSIYRRLGLDYEDGYAKTDCGYSNSTLLETEKSFHKWNFAGGNSNISLGVVQVKDKLYFLDMTATSPSSSLKNGGVPITISGLGNSRIETTPINNGLVVVSADLVQPVYLEYDTSADTVSQSNIDIKIRDFWGIEDTLDVSNRPSLLSDQHHYNLLNQGWPSDNITSFKTIIGTYPSNADTWTLGKNSSSTFDASLLVKNSMDRAPSPKGKFILDIFTRGVSRVSESGISGLPADYETGTLTTVTTFAGRVVYSGVISSLNNGDEKSPNYSGSIFFTKTIGNKADLGICYQEADPTSEYISDVIDTDGGVISIPEANRIIKIITLKNSLVVFAENGIWEIFGSDYGFKATDYQMSKVTNLGISNPKSVVVAGDALLYWAKNGIFVLSVEPTSGRLITQNISLTTIQSFYNDLPSLAKNQAKGFYDQKENKVRWLYSEESDDEYHKELILDLELQSFYTNSVFRGTAFIADYIEIPNYVNTSSVEDVYSAGTLVVVGANTVQVENLTINNRDSVFSFLTFTESGYFTLAKYTNTSFLDWVTEFAGYDYNSYLITGYEIFGDILRKKQATYLVMLFERTETGFYTLNNELYPLNPSSCLVQAQWNWNNSPAGGKWGTQYQAYRYKRKYTPMSSADDYDTGERVISTRSKIRGNGKALSLYFQSETGKDMKILGWAIPMSGTGGV